MPFTIQHMPIGVIASAALRTGRGQRVMRDQEIMEDRRRFQIQKAMQEAQFRFQNQQANRQFGLQNRQFGLQREQFKVGQDQFAQQMGLRERSQTHAEDMDIARQEFAEQQYAEQPDRAKAAAKMMEESRARLAKQQEELERETAKLTEARRAQARKSMEKDHATSLVATGAFTMEQATGLIELARYDVSLRELSATTRKRLGLSDATGKGASPDLLNLITARMKSIASMQEQADSLKVKDPVTQGMVVPPEHEEMHKKLMTDSAEERKKLDEAMKELDKRALAQKRAEEAAEKARLDALEKGRKAKEKPKAPAEPDPFKNLASHIEATTGVIQYTRQDNHLAGTGVTGTGTDDDPTTISNGELARLQADPEFVKWASSSGQVFQTFVGIGNKIGKSVKFRITADGNREKVMSLAG